MRSRLLRDAGRRLGAANGVDAARGVDHEAPVPRSLSLVLPTFEEAGAIARVVEEARAVLRSAGVRFEIVVVDDGSRDDTAERVQVLCASMPELRLVRLPENRGYGAALRAGFAAAGMDAIAYMDSDGQLDPRDLLGLLSALDEVDLALGVRQRRAEGALRWLLSRAYHRLATAVLEIEASDLNCALKVVRRERLAIVTPRTDGYLAGAEVVARAYVRGLSIGERPVAHRPRFVGQSKVTLRRSVHALGELWLLRGRLAEATSEAVPSRPRARELSALKSGS